MTTPNPVFLYTIIEPHWGYIIRQPGATAAQAAYILPPPTTVVGAYANPLARILDIPDYIEKRKRSGPPVQNSYMECLVSSTLAAGAGLLKTNSVTVGAVTYEEPSRIMGTPYKGGGSYQAAVKKPIYMSATELLPVQAVGATSAPGAQLVISWLVDTARLESCLGKSIGLGDLERAAWGVYRLGSREGLVETLHAGIVAGASLDVKSQGGYRSILYQDARCAHRRMGTITTIAMIGLDYREREYLVPAGEPSGANLLTPPSGPVMFYLRDPQCRAAGTRISWSGVGLDLYLAFRG